MNEVHISIINEILLNTNNILFLVFTDKTYVEYLFAQYKLILIYNVALFGFNQLF